MMRLIGHFTDQLTMLQKFLLLSVFSSGGAATAKLANEASLLATVPTYGAELQFWGAVSLTFFLILGAALTAVNMLFVVQKNWHDARERQRKELQDIAKKAEEEQHKLDELACARRRTNLICPLQKLLPDIDIKCQQNQPPKP